MLVCFSGSYALAQTVAGSLHDRVEKTIFSAPGQALDFAQQELEAARKNSPEEVRALVDLAKCHYYADAYPIGEDYLEKARKIAWRINDAEGKAWVLYHTGDLQILKGKYGSGIENISAALQQFKKLGNSEGIALSMNGIGVILLQQENYEEAMNYFKGALKYGNDVTHGDSYTYLSRLYLEMEAFDDAESFAFRALRMGRKNKDEYVQSTAYDVLGYLATIKGNHREAQQYFAISMELKRGLEDLQGVSITALDIARAKKELGETDSARYYTRLSYQLANEIGAKEEIKNSSLMLSRLLAAGGSYDSAFYYQNRYITLNDELYDEQASKKMAEMEARVLEQENKQRIRLLEQEKQFESRSKTTYLIAGIIGIVLLSVTIFFVFNRYNLKKKSHDKLAAKNQIIETQNHDILESIRYAKRLQEAILPEVSYIRQRIPRFFVTYLPKDIIAGDFYWYEQQEDRTLIACCDCTGHGVPGAMVSVVCSNAMNRVVRELHKTIPGEILDETRRLVIENFNQFRMSDQEVKDGMDISLLAFNKDYSEVQFSGAHHALWILRRGADEIEVVKGDKQPIGKFETYQPFSTHTVAVYPGDRIYLFTDGYADQFGGPDGKKMKTPALRKLLLEVRSMELSAQQKPIEAFFNSWKGQEEQVDDVSLMAIEI